MNTTSLAPVAQSAVNSAAPDTAIEIAQANIVKLNDELSRAFLRWQELNDLHTQAKAAGADVSIVAAAMSEANRQINDAEDALDRGIDLLRRIEERPGPEHFAFKRERETAHELAAARAELDQHKLVEAFWKVVDLERVKEIDALKARSVSAVTMAPNETPANGATPPDTRRGRLIVTEGQIQLFKGYTYVEDIHRVLAPDGDILDSARFEKRFGGRTFTRAIDDEVDSAWDAFTNSALIEFPYVRGMYFDPKDTPGAIVVREGRRFINSWSPLDIASAEGDVSLYVDHIKRLLPNGDDALIYLSYVAACVQYLGHKAAWALFIVSTPGAGKGFLTKVLTYCLGQRYVHSAAADNLDNHFNAWLYGKLLVCVEEIMVAEGKASTWQRLKTMITETAQEIEAKGVDQVTREICCNFIFNSNHKDGLRKDKDDRRICPLFFAQQSVEDLKRDGMDEAYFIRLWDWFDDGGAAAIFHFLSTFPIPDKYNFTKGARRAPRTTATDEAIEASLGSAEQEILEAISSGVEGFKGGWIASHKLKSLLDQSTKGRFVAQNKRLDMLKALGYEKHPGLSDDGRIPVALPDGQRPRLYVKPGHSTEALRGAAVTTAYLTAQAAGMAKDNAPSFLDAPPQIPPPPSIPHQ